MKNASFLVKIEEKLTFFGVFGIFVVLGFLISFFYSPVIRTHAYDTPGVTTVVLGVEPTISLSLDRSELNLTGTMNSFVHGLVNVSVVTNSAYGYTLGLEDVDEDSSMHHENSNISDVVTSKFSGAKTSEQMENNTWGYSLDETNYYFVPSYGIASRLKTTEEPMIEADVTPVYFGVKVGVLTSGVYNDTVMFSAYVNGYDYTIDGKSMLDPGVRPSLQNFSDYNSDCYNLAPGQIISLIDERDGKSYRVLRTKTNGGPHYCWMIDNLSLEVTEPLSEEDSDIHSSFTMQYASSMNDFITRVNNGETNLAYIDPEKGGFYTKDNIAIDGRGSICPRGWGVPSVSTSRIGTYNINFIDYFHGSMAEMSEFFPATDGYIDPVNGFIDTTTRYWAYYITSPTMAVLDSSGISKDDNIEKYGVPLRCVAANAK